MIASLSPIATVALAAVVAVAGCVASSPQGAQEPVKASVPASQAAVPPHSSGGAACGGAAAAASRAFATAAKTVVVAPVACSDLVAGGVLVAGCESGAVGAVTRQALTCAAIKESAHGRYPACSGLDFAASRSGPLICDEPPPPPEPDTPIEVGSLTGHGYIYKSRDLVWVRTSTASGVAEITGQQNPDGTTTIETRGFTAIRNRDGTIASVQFHDELK